MDYNPRQIEQKWKSFWDKNEVYKVTNSTEKPKFYVLDMFPYPSGSGLHVGHPLGYIASDIFARYKRHKGFNVLHPMGYDAFGLPAEQYAIQTGVHPATSTDENIERYRGQLDNIGFSFDWSRQVKTSDPSYYKWTQWIFLQLFESYYDNEANKAGLISDLVTTFETKGNATVNAATTQDEIFTADEWNAMSAKAKEDILMNYRLAYRKVGYVNWCEALGTVLANDEVKDGVSERGGYPVEHRAMLQWSLRITAYAERMLTSLDALEWTDSLKAQQRNWIGRSEGSTLFFDIDGNDGKIEVFTTRLDTIYGVTFMVLAPEHDLVAQITTAEQQPAIDKYLTYVNARSERERMSDVKEVTGEFTGAYAINPFTNTRIPIYIGEYVLKDYGTGAIMAVPSDDERDNRFATKFGIDIIEVVDKSDYPGATTDDKVGKIINSDFLNGLEVKDAIRAAIDEAEKRGIGKGMINYRLRDANYSRQRYWGEPFPISYDKDGITKPLDISELPLNLPDLDDYKPASGGKSPLARLDNWVNLENGLVRETDTMPGFAGSSWYFLRYMDATNDERFVGEKAINYWKEVDLYVGGTEHAVGHLMYSRFWHKVLFDKGLVPTNEPFKKLINQGMIQGRSSFVYRVNEQLAETIFSDKLKEYGFSVQHEFPIAGGYVDFAMPEHKLAIEIKSSSDLKRYLENNKGRFEEEGWKLLVISTQEVGKYYRNFDIMVKRINRAIEGQIDNTHLDEEYAHPLFVSLDVVKEKNLHKLVSALHVDVNIVKNDVLDTKAFQEWRPEYKNACFVTNKEGNYICGSAVEKMSKSKYNVVNPDLMVEKYGADCFRMYEMFLGPIEQSKPWNTHGIEGVSKFLRKFWSLFYKGEELTISDAKPTKADYKILHTAIKKVTEDIERFSLNTCVSAFMVLANELKSAKCNKKEILQEFVVLIAPFAPFVAEELWHQLGNEGTVMNATYPTLNEDYLKEDSFTYPIAINGKMRDKIDLPADTSKADAEAAALALPKIQKHIEGKTIRKVIVVPKRMINIVVG